MRALVRLVVLVAVLLAPSPSPRWRPRTTPGTGTTEPTTAAEAHRPDRRPDDGPDHRPGHGHHQPAAGPDRHRRARTRAPGRATRRPRRPATDPTPPPALPVTTIDRAPANPTQVPAGSVVPSVFAFHADLPGATFQCRIIGAGGKHGIWEGCPGGVAGQATYPDPGGRQLHLPGPRHPRRRPHLRQPDAGAHLAGARLHHHDDAVQGLRARPLRTAGRRQLQQPDR